MDKFYLDRTEIPGNTVLLVSNAEIINTGTTVFSMPVSCKAPEYDRYAQDYDIRFIFDDAVPVPDFYTVPQADIFATDSRGGCWCTIGESFDKDSPIYYIDKDRRCYWVAESGQKFIDSPELRYSHLTAYTGIEFFPSKEAAKAKYELFGTEALNKLREEALRQAQQSHE